jgi:hypothetical protein
MNLSEDYPHRDLDCSQPLALVKQGAAENPESRREVRNMDEATKALLTQVVGVTDEDLAKVSRPLEKMLSNVPRMMQYRIVAEVTSSKYCFAGLKVGDKIVFSPFLNKEETTAPLCPWALLPVFITLRPFWERTIELLDRGIEGIDDLNDGVMTKLAGCLDLGLDAGGLGHVDFKLYAEKIS